MFALTVICGVLLFVSIRLVVFRLLIQHQLVRVKEKEHVEEAIKKSKIEPHSLPSKVPLQNYPKENLGLNDFSWKEILKKGSPNILQLKLEAQLSQKLAPYFGLSKVLISMEAPSQTLSLSLMGTLEKEDNQKKIEANAIAFVSEAKEIPKLLQIHIEIIVTSDKTNTPMYKETFLRKQDNQKFSNLKTAVNRNVSTNN